MWMVAEHAQQLLELEDDEEVNWKIPKNFHVVARLKGVTQGLRAWIHHYVYADCWPCLQAPCLCCRCLTSSGILTSQRQKHWT